MALSQYGIALTQQGAFRGIPDLIMTTKNVIFGQTIGLLF